MPQPKRRQRFARGSRRDRLPRCAGCAVWLVICCWLFGAPSEARGAAPRKASSGWEARKNALQSIPIEKLDSATREKIAGVVNKTSVYRRLPTVVMRCDPELYLFVVDHPEILANVWQLMEIEDVVLTPTGPNTYTASDGDGTEGNVEYLLRNHDTHLIYAKGSYEGPLFTQPITGSCVLLLKTAYSREPDGYYYLTVRLDTFLHLDHVGLDFLAKTFQPLVCKVADYNFVATASFMESLSHTAEVNQDGMQRLGAKLLNVDPDVRDQFILLTGQVAQRAALRRQLQPAAATPLANEVPLTTRTR